MERCPLCGAKTSPKGFDVILTTDMLREIAKDVDIVASSHLGRQNIKSLLIASADEIERLRKVGSNMATTIADNASKAPEFEKVMPAATDTEEIDPPSEKEMAREMAPTLKGKKHKK